MMGPQWLCDCNESGGAETVQAAGEQAAQHFLTHSPDSGMSVSVYRERNEWLYSIFTETQAREIAYPWRQASVETLTKANTPPPKTVKAVSSTPMTPGSTVSIKDSSGEESIYTVLSTAATAMDTFTHRLKRAGETARELSDSWKKPIDLGSLTRAEAEEQFHKSMVALQKLALAKLNETVAARRLGSGLVFDVK